MIHGEFLIYAITIVAGSTRLIAKSIPSRGPFVSRQGFNLVSHVMIFPAIVAYVLLRYIGTVNANPYAVNAKLVVIYSIALLIAAFIFSYVVFLIHAQRSTPEELLERTAAAIAHAPDRLQAEFRELRQSDPEVAPRRDPPAQNSLIGIKRGAGPPFCLYDYLLRLPHPCVLGKGGNSAEAITPPAHLSISIRPAVVR